MSKIRSAAAKTPVERLYRRFEEAHAALHALPPSKTACDAREIAFNRAVDKCARIMNQIVRSPARRIDDMLVKIRVVGWATGVRYKKLSDLDNWKPHPLLARGEEFEALVSLRDDVRQILKCGLTQIASAPRAVQS